MIEHLKQVVKDYMRERRIDSIRREIEAAERAGDMPRLRLAWIALRAEVNSRSDASIARMERAKGLA